MPRITYGRAAFDCTPPETVLDVLLREGCDIPFSCRKGICFTCIMQAVDGEVPAAAQTGLKGTLRAKGYFLSCMYRPDTDVTVAAAADAAIFTRAVVTRVERSTPKMCRIFLAPATSLFYHPGQFINLRRRDGLSRSYSLASVPRVEPDLELHVKSLPGGRMTSWVFDELRAGEEVDFQGPNGTCFYVSGRPGQPLLLIGNGSGLAPLIGIAPMLSKTGTMVPFIFITEPGTLTDSTCKTLCAVSPQRTTILSTTRVSPARVSPSAAVGGARTILRFQITAISQIGECSFRAIPQWCMQPRRRPA